MRNLRVNVNRGVDYPGSFVGLLTHLVYSTIDICFLRLLRLTMEGQHSLFVGKYRHYCLQIQSRLENFADVQPLEKICPDLDSGGQNVLLKHLYNQKSSLQKGHLREAYRTRPSDHILLSDDKEANIREEHQYGFHQVLESFE